MGSMGSDKAHVSVGPWGGMNGPRWDDGVYSGVKQVVISYGAGIDCVQFAYDKNGCSVWSEKHGGSGGVKTAKIKFDYPDEFLVSISGYYGGFVEFGPLLVRALVFQSNKKKYGPFGIQQGTHFSIPIGGGKVVGFYGRSSWYLDSIGVYLRPTLQQNLSNKATETPKFRVNNASNERTKNLDLVPPNGKDNNLFESDQFLYEVERMGKMMVVDQTAKGFINPRQALAYGPAASYKPAHAPAPAPAAPYAPGPAPASAASYAPGPAPAASYASIASYGPWGGNGTMLFDDGVHTGVREIHLTTFGDIVSIKVCYDLNGQAIWANKNGGDIGIRQDKIAFNYPSEILTHISGYYGPTISGGATIVKSLTFHTNNRKYGPFGVEQGSPFTSGSKSGIVIGFHGRKSWFINSIGVHVLEGKPQLPLQLAYDSFNMNNSRICEVAPEIVKEPPVIYGSGPWGGDGGKPWDDGIFSGVKKIFLAKGQAIYCVQIEYDQNGQSAWSVKHGGGAEGDSHTIKFDYPDEILTGICGYHSSLTGDECAKVVKSLTFYTNKRKYGPYGEETGTFFTSKKSQVKIVGFHGRSGCYLNSIGIHMQHWLNDRDSKLQAHGDRGGAARKILNKLFAS